MAANCSGSVVPWAQPIMITIYAILSFGAVTGNLLILIAVFSIRRMRTVSNCFIAILAFNDLLVGLLLDTMYAVKTGLNLWDTSAGNSFLLVVESVSLQSVFAACWSLCAVSVDRYLAITRVFTYHELMTKQRCLFIAIAIFTCSFAMMTGRFIVSTENLSQLWIASAIIMYVIPLSIISFCYFNIFKEARAQSRRIATETVMASREAQEAAKNRKASFTVAIIIGLFFLGYSPASIIAVLQNYTSSQCYKRELDENWFYCGAIILLSSTLNPLIYGLRSTEFRRAFKKVLRFKVSESSNTTYPSQSRTRAPATIRVESVQSLGLKAKE